ncbi:unnamed protein product [Rhizophagus irregularis]|nr:unnamed protein product [Rhizophagus irregularis]
MNLTVQEILKQIKAEEAQDEDMILEEFCNSRTTHTYEMIPKPLHDTTMIERELEEFSISTEEWNQMKELCRVFEIFHKATVKMSKEQYITLSSSIPVYNILLDHLEKLLDDKNKEYCTISEIRTAITKGYEKLKTYYAKTDESHVYPIATILDPRMKLKYYLQQEWEQEYIDAAIKVIKDTYNKHYQNDSLLNNSNLEVQENNQENFFSLFEIGNDSSEEDELDEYLRKPVAHEATYPRLAAIARDYLAIPGTSVPVERIFSGGADLITKKRSSLGIETIRACSLESPCSGLYRRKKSSPIELLDPEIFTFKVEALWKALDLVDKSAHMKCKIYYFIYLIIPISDSSQLMSSSKLLSLTLFSKSSIPTSKLLSLISIISLSKSSISSKAFEMPQVLKESMIILLEISSQEHFTHPHTSHNLAHRRLPPVGL